ncbi:MAG: hypothetical protein WBA48_00680 [Xanthobacteraceae bacterium]
MQTASDVALEIAAMIRAYEGGQTIEETAAAEAIDRLLSSSARTPRDALACITLARRLFNVCDGNALVCDGAMSLIRMASDALEKSTGERAAKFAGHEWH